ncbi:MAG: hypothetical protein U9N36_06840 [Euryarchaeota archaeon]|nr:hypothetical protein [Euryarchaeota archaeon]
MNHPIEARRRAEQVLTSQDRGRDRNAAGCGARGVVDVRVGLSNYWALS